MLYKLKMALKKQDLQFILDRITSHLQYAFGENHFLTY